MCYVSFFELSHMSRKIQKLNFNTIKPIKPKLKKHIMKQNPILGLYMRLPAVAGRRNEDSGT